MEEKYDSSAAKACASSAGLDYEKVAKCADGPDGDAAEEDMAKATPDHPGVPYIVVNGKAIDDPSSLLEAVCSAYTGAKPAGCSGVASGASSNPKFALHI
mmetsp:Transcript_82074/g.254801  ORF Transcript_82074/g.254801 Transcript_82074/m.254801 type:complete len:100 (+) Transcript_82074:481-780(+)